MEFWLTQAFNGISYGAMLFLLGSGLSLVFGVMRIVNLAHGSYFLLGGYVGLTTVLKTKSFPLALLSGALSVALIGLGMERFFLRKLGRQSLSQVLMTMGFALVFQDLGLLIWGGDPYTLAVPAFLARSAQVGPVFVPFYRLFIIAVALAVGIALWAFLERTRARAIPLVACAALLLAAPPFLPPYALTLLTQILIYAIFAMSLDLLLGYTGLASLGHAAYFGVAAYVVAILTTQYHASFWLCLCAALLAASAVAAIFGLIAIRAAGVYFLMITLALGMVIWGLAFRWVSLTMGDNGISGIARPSILPGWSLARPIPFHYL